MVMIMGEVHNRCRFWPRCAIHVGRDRPRTLTDGEWQQIRAAYRETGRYHGVNVDLAREFGVSKATIERAVRMERESVR